MFKKMAKTLLERRHRSGQPLTPEILQSAWPMMVGDYIAEHTRPMRLRGARLEIVVTSAPRMNEFTWLKAELLRRINALLPIEIEDLVFSLARPDELSAPTTEARPPAPLGEIPARERALLEAIEDEELRAVLTRVRQLSRGRQVRSVMV